MKRLIIWELVVLALLLIASVVLLVVSPTFNFGAETTADPTVVTTAPTTATTATTAPTATVAPTQPTEPAEPTWSTYPEDRQLLAQQYFVYDCKENAFLTSSGDANTKVYPASITKLFTAYVAMQYLEPVDEITAGDGLEFVVAGSSVAKIEAGDVLTVEQLVEAMLLPSGNDAAYILACEAGRIIKNDPKLSATAAKDAFVAQMNTQAKDLGMTGTKFLNPDGIHEEGHYTTFGDLAILGKLAMANETIMKYAAIAKEEVTLHEETVEWKNTNKLIDSTTTYFCPYALGLKTGQTPNAGSCLLSAFRKDDTELLIGVFGCPKEDDRFDDTLQLFNQIVLK